MTEDARARIAALLRVEALDPVRPARAVVHDREAWRSVERQRVVLVADDGHEVPCFFLTPRHPPPWDAAVIAVHQHNGEFEWGKSEIIGLDGNPDLAYALELAQAGVPVLAPDLNGFEERRANRSEPARAEQLDAWARITNDKTLQGLHVEDVALAISWLEDHDDVDGPIGIVGHSLGGQVAFFSLACDPRLRAGVISCGVGTLESFDAHSVLHNPAWYVPGLRSSGDSQIVAQAIDGQKAMVLAGRSDPIFPFDGVQKVVGSFGQGVCEFVPFDGGHAFPRPQREAALDWLVTTLRSGRALAPGPACGC